MGVLDIDSKACSGNPLTSTFAATDRRLPPFPDPSALLLLPPPPLLLA
jgi:hypothetical protein